MLLSFDPYIVVGPAVPTQPIGIVFPANSLSDPFLEQLKPNRFWATNLAYRSTYEEGRYKAVSTIILTQASLKITQAAKKRGYNTLQVVSSTRLKTTSNTRTHLRMRDNDTIGNILDVIDRIESDFKTLKTKQLND